MKFKPRHLHKRFLILTIIIIIHINNNDVLMDVVAVGWRRRWQKSTHVCLDDIHNSLRLIIFRTLFKLILWKWRVFGIESIGDGICRCFIHIWRRGEKTCQRVWLRGIYVSGTLSYVRARRTVSEGLITMHNTPRMYKSKETNNPSKLRIRSVDCVLGTIWKGGGKKGWWKGKSIRTECGYGGVWKMRYNNV